MSFADEAIVANENDGEVTLEVRLSTPFFRPVTVAYTIGGGSAVPGVDYTAADGILTFNPGQLVRTIRITLRSDGRNEPNKTIQVRLSGPSNATLGGSDTAVVTITDDDPPPTVSFIGMERTVAERDGSAVFTVELSEVSELAVAVPYTVGGTASPGDVNLGTGDHNLRSGVAVIPAGATSARVRFTILDDRIDEDDETVQISLGTPLNADLVSPTVYVVTITDDDTAAVRLSNTRFTLNEGQSAGYTVVLESEPTRPVTVKFNLDGQLSTTPGELTFTSLNWSQPQTVTLTALDDAVDEASPHPGLLRHVVESADPRYHRIDQRANLEITASITDDDTAAVLVGAVSPLIVTESAQITNTATYTVALQSQPTAPVTITVAPDNQLSASPAELVFDATNWRAPQTVTVTVIDDASDESDTHQGRITHTVTTTDAVYANLQGSARPADVTLDIVDDDTAGIILSGGTLALSEDPAAPNHVGTYTVTLTSRPSAPVNVNLTVLNRAQVTFTPATLVFGVNATSWSTPQTVTVTAMNDRVDEGPDAIPHSQQLNHTVTSTDPNFDGLIQAKLVTITDNDTAGVTVNAPVRTVAEGGTLTYTVQLATEPELNVTLTLADGPSGLVSVSPLALNFNRTNWMTPTVVTVTGQENSLIDGSRAVTITQTISGSDPAYPSTLSPQPLSLTVTDNDVAGLAFSAPISITEGLSGTYTAALTSQPTQDVTVTVSLPPVLLGAQPSLVFTPSTWNISQTVTVTATDNRIAQGDIVAPLDHRFTSADPNFDGRGPFTYPLTVADDETAGLLITPVTGTLTETLGSPPQTFTISLTSEPTAPVTVTLVPDAQVQIDTTALVFTSANYTQPQTVTVTAVDDAIAETRPHTGTILLAGTSADANYNRAWPDDTVYVAIEDDDLAVVGVSQPSSLATNESGAAVTFQIWLTSEPTSPVTISVGLSAGAEASLSVAAPWQLPLVFDRNNWMQPVTLTVRGLDDGNYDGAQPFQILIAAADSSDPGYSGRVPALPLIELRNDDDEPALASLGDPGAVYEGNSGAATVAFPVTLARPALVTTTVSYATYDISAMGGADYATTAGVITFTPGLTSSAEVLTVPVFGDRAFEPDELFGVRLTGVTAPGDISGLGDAFAVGTIANDDAPGLRFELGETSVREGVGTANVIVRLEQAQAAPVSVEYSTLELAPDAGTATAGDDYVAAGDLLTFAPGELTKTISLTINDDGLTEDLFETVRLQLRNPALVALSEPSEATLTIMDDDRASPLATPLFLLTGGPLTNSQHGFYYTGGAAGFGYVAINVPCSWPDGRALSIELWSPGMYGGSSDVKGADGVRQDTAFELYALGPANPSDNLTPAAGTSGTPVTVFSPDVGSEGWLNLRTISAPTPCGRYLVRAAAAGDDENYWAVRAGFDTDGDPATPPDPVAGDQRITLAAIRSTFEHAAASSATTSWFYVAPGTTTLQIQTYDLDQGPSGLPADLGARIRYYAPDDRYDPLGVTGGIPGTASSLGWSVDTLSKPQAGWWRAVVFTSRVQNTYVLEALADAVTLPLQFEAPQRPAVNLSLAASTATAAPGARLSLTAAYQSLGETTATNLTLTLTLPADLAFDGDPCAAAPAGCSWDPSGTLTLQPGNLAPGATGSHSIAVIVASEAKGLAAVALGATFGDETGNLHRTGTGATVTVP